MCNKGKGSLPGKKAFCARRSITEESFPMEYNITGFANSAAASRRMKMLSASSARRCFNFLPAGRDCCPCAFGEVTAVISIPVCDIVLLPPRKGRAKTKNPPASWFRRWVHFLQLEFRKILRHEPPRARTHRTTTETTRL